MIRVSAKIEPWHGVGAERPDCRVDFCRPLLERRQYVGKPVGRVGDALEMWIA